MSSAQLEYAQSTIECVSQHGTFTSVFKACTPDTPSRSILCIQGRLDAAAMLQQPVCAHHTASKELPPRAFAARVMHHTSSDPFLLFAMPRVCWTTDVPVSKQAARAQVAALRKANACRDQIHATRALFAYLRRTPDAHALLCSHSRLFIPPPLSARRPSRLSRATLGLLCGFPLDRAPFKELRPRVMCVLDYDAPEDFREAVTAALRTAAALPHAADRVVWAAWAPALLRPLTRNWRAVHVLALVPATPHDVTLLAAVAAQPQQIRLVAAMRSATAAADADMAGLRALDAAGRAYTRHDVQLHTAPFSKLLCAALRIARASSHLDDFFTAAFMNVVNRAETPRCAFMPLSSVIDCLGVPLACEASAAHGALLCKGAMRMCRTRVLRLDLPLACFITALTELGVRVRSRDWVRFPEIVLAADMMLSVGSVHELRVHRAVVMPTGSLAVLELLAPADTGTSSMIAAAFVRNPLLHDEADVAKLLCGTLHGQPLVFQEPIDIRATTIERAAIIAVSY
jgi:hypothetical protein